jgi:flagellar biosynthesis chaperone FliJ
MKRKYLAYEWAKYNSFISILDKLVRQAVRGQMEGKAW